MGSALARRSETLSRAAQCQEQASAQASAFVSAMRSAPVSAALAQAWACATASQALAPAWGQHRRRRSDAAETSHDSHPIMRRESPQREARRTHTGSDEVTHTLRGGRDATAATCSCDNLDVQHGRASFSTCYTDLCCNLSATGMGKTFYAYGPLRGTLIW